MCKLGFPLQNEQDFIIHFVPFHKRYSIKKCRRGVSILFLNYLLSMGGSPSSKYFSQFEFCMPTQAYCVENQHTF